ncbi:MAG: transporter [Bacteroidetes bacterium]|nr:transporter [Bacteroidota bacterium]MBS1941320.1 transporter [Bacteroidota bacterium]
MKWMLPVCLSLPMAMEAQWEPMATDRPDRSESATTVPGGSLQMESGCMMVLRGAGIANGPHPQFLLRTGLGGEVEIRVTGHRSPVVLPDGGLVGAWDPPGIGIKAGLGNGGPTGIVTALLAQVGLPHWSGHAERRTTTGVLIAADRKLGDQAEICINVGLDGDRGYPGANGLYSTAVSWELAEWLDLFAEIYGSQAADGPVEHGWDCGATWAIGKNVQLDANAGNGFQGQAWYFGAGVSFRAVIW